MADYASLIRPTGYYDISAYSRDKGNLRLALHAAIALFHMSDWVFHTHEGFVRTNFTFKDKAGNTKPVSDSATFANSLEESCEDFGRIRGIAHAAKHLKLREVRPVPNAPSHAANTAVHEGGFTIGIFDQGSFDSGRKVMLSGANGIDVEFSNIASTVYEMWRVLQSKHNW
jgi:hypothetical protein